MDRNRVMIDRAASCSSLCTIVLNIEDSLVTVERYTFFPAFCCFNVYVIRKALSFFDWWV